MDKKKKLFKIVGIPIFAREGFGRVEFYDKEAFIVEELCQRGFKFTNLETLQEEIDRLMTTH